jgi:inorganic pyrophosphatase
MIVATPCGSRNKYAYDPNLQVFRLDRTLYSPMHYPGDHGFFPGTMNDNGDPVEVLCLVEQPGWPGTVMEVRPVGLLTLSEEHEADQTVIAVTNRSPRHEQIDTFEQIAPHVRFEIEHFFEIYEELKGKVTQACGWVSRDECRQLLVRSRQRYLREHAALSGRRS